MVYDKQLTTVRIIAVNLEKHGLNEILIVSTLHGNRDSMENIRIFLKESAINFETLKIANEFYKELVRYRLLLKKKVYIRHVYQTFNDLRFKYANDKLPFVSVERVYIANLKIPQAVLKKPRSNYIRIKSDTYRLMARDEMIRIEKERYKKIKEKNKNE